MRLFVAVNFSEEVKSRILEVQEQLRSKSSRGNFTRLENFHLTMAFLGETPEEKLAILLRIIEELGTAPFDVIFNRTGCFSRSRKELWWIGAARNCPGFPLLEALHAQLIGRLSYAGFSVEKRPFNPHITLGREIKHSGPISLDCPEIVVKVDIINLMKSENIQGVLTYSIIL